MEKNIWKEKYLKYKNKYLQLKQFAGSIDLNNFYESQPNKKQPTESKYEKQTQLEDNNYTSNNNLDNKSPEGNPTSPTYTRRNTPSPTYTRRNPTSPTYTRRNPSSPIITNSPSPIITNSPSPILNEKGVIEKLKKIAYDLRRSKNPNYPGLPKPLIENYNNFMCDHSIIYTFDKNTLLISLNVENNLLQLFDNENENANDIINIKNAHICQKLQDVINNLHMYVDKIIINIQEGYPTIYKLLITNLNLDGYKGKPTKLICSYLYEGFLNGPINKMSRNPDGTTSIISDVGLHTRLWLNSCFFSILFDKHVPYIKDTSYLYNEKTFQNLVKSEDLEDVNKNKCKFNDFIYSRIFLREQNKEENKNLFLETSLVLPYLFVDTKTQNLSIKLKCDGICFEIGSKSYLNIHLSAESDKSNKKYGINDNRKMEPLFKSISNNTFRSIRTDFASDTNINTYRQIFDELIIRYINQDTNHKPITNAVCLGDFNYIKNIQYQRFGFRYNFNNYSFYEMPAPKAYPTGLDHFVRIIKHNDFWDYF